MIETPVPDIEHAASCLHELPTLLIILLLMAAMMVTATIGFLAGRRQHAKTPDSGRGHFNAVQASLLGLLALLLSFNINLANQRFDARRQLVLDDANNIGALGLRGSYLSEPRRAEFIRLLRDYVATRVAAHGSQPGVSRQDLAARLAQAAGLHARLCDLVRAEIQGEHPAKGAETMATLLIDAQAILWKRAYAFQSRVPDPIVFLLLGAAVAAAGIVGYSGGLGQHRGTVQSVLLTLFVSGTFFVILALDRPQESAMKVDQDPVMRMKEALDREVARSK